MAFKILSEEQINRLSPRQRENYLDAYNKYREREEFVKRAERQRNIKVAEYKMKKRPIKRIGRAPSLRIKIAPFNARLDEVGDRLFNTTKQTTKRVEHLGKQRQIAPVTMHVPGVKVASGKKMQIKLREKARIKLDSIPIAVLPQNKCNFDEPKISVDKVFNGFAPKIEAEANKTKANINRLPKIKILAVKSKDTLPPKREKPILPNATLALAADVHCKVGKPHIKSIEIEHFQNPVINPVNTQKHSVRAIKKTIAVPFNLKFKQPAWSAPNTRGVSTLFGTNSISAVKPELKQVSLNQQKQIKAPLVSFGAKKQLPMPKDIPDVTVTAISQRSYFVKKPAFSRLPAVQMIKPKKIGVPKKCTKYFKAEGVVFNANAVNYHPIKPPCLETKNYSRIVVPRSIDQSAELKKILGIMG